MVGRRKRLNVGRTVDTDELVGCAEIARRLGFAGAETVHNWRRRFPDSFPTPVARLKIGLIFVWSDVEQWAEWNRKHLRVIEYNEPMMSVTEAAKYLGVRDSSIYRWIEGGHLEATPRPARIRSSDIETLLERVRLRPRRPFAED